MADSALLNEGDKIVIGQQFGVEGATGNVTGLHTHIEMQNYVVNGNKWIYASNDSSLWNKVYFSPTDYMGFPNELGISVYYDGVPIEPEPPIVISTIKKKFPWVIYSRKLRERRSK